MGSATDCRRIDPRHPSLGWLVSFARGLRSRVDENATADFNAGRETAMCVRNHQENTRCSANAGLMLGHRLRRWHNIKPTLAEHLVFAADWACILGRCYMLKKGGGK